MIYLVSAAIFCLSLIAFSGLFAMLAGASDAEGRGGGLVVTGILMFLFSATAAVVLFGWYLKQ